jgi:hypoxanthine phosphoribosyltransferase
MTELSFKAITERVQELKLPSFDLVIGIATGGLVPASLIAYKLQAELRVMQMNYRDPSNKPRHSEPVLLHRPGIPPSTRTILLVDDVSVSGSTMEAAKSELSGYEVTTLVMKGKADYSLFPEIADCVNWPWKTASV